MIQSDSRLFINIVCKSIDPGELLVNLELMEAGYPPIDIKFTDRVAYYNAFDEYHVNHNLNAMEKLFAGYVNTRLDSYLAMLEE